MNIWYIEFLESWATTDKTGAVHIWDISLNKVKNSYFVTGDVKKELNHNYGAMNQSRDPQNTVIDRNISLKSVTAIKNRDLLTESP